ncbi:MAG: hypothetical protein WC794_04810 [Candidatus Doudnabacteria bacterium]|jgi:hypothetical protein
MGKLAKINFSAIKDLAVHTVKNLSWLFIFIFFVILILDVMRVKNSVQVVLDINSEPAPKVKEKGVRIDFINYDKVVKRIQDGQGYQPKIELTANPFALK